MSIFNFFKGPDFNEGLAEFRQTNGAVLLDVRTSAEYEDSHIPEAINIPLDNLGNVETEIPDKSTKIFVCCASGARSAHAENQLQRMGYTKVKNIGGMY